jgi:HlyD family secretion protein
MKNLAPHFVIVLALCAPLLASCGNKTDEGWLGYIEGEDALIAPPQPGWITSLAVTRGQSVAPGDLLFTLDNVRETAARDNAAAALAAAQATSKQAQADVQQNSKELQRQQGLVRIGGTPQQAVEQAQDASASARARLEQNHSQEDVAKAQLATADFNLAERDVHSKVMGRVEDIYFRTGEYANAGTPVVSILPPQNVYVRFFVPETALSGLTQGMRVHVGCDGCRPDLEATIAFIAQSSEFTPPVLYSVQNRSRLVFKVEARFDNDADRERLRPGLPVNVTVAAH